MDITLEALRKRYRYEHPRDLIGKGGFADVYKAFDLEDRIWVALKFYKGEWSSKYNVSNEIRRIKPFSRHRNLIEHFEAYEVLLGKDIHDETIRYQVGILEYANAGSLTDFLKANPPRTVLGPILEDIMNGLRHLHAKKIVHRDLKPHNILLGSDGERITAKIADFGISRLLEDNSEATNSQVIGTVEYMSPEQYEPQQYGLNGKIGLNSDLWTLGIVIYEMYTGQLPFGRRSSGQSQQEIIVNVLKGQLPEPLATLPEPYQTIVRKCLVRNAGERAKSVDELLPEAVRHDNLNGEAERNASVKKIAQRLIEQETTRQSREGNVATLSGSTPKPQHRKPLEQPSDETVYLPRNKPRGSHFDAVLPATDQTERLNLGPVGSPASEPRIRSDEKPVGHTEAGGFVRFIRAKKRVIALSAVGVSVVSIAAGSLWYFLPVSDQPDQKGAVMTTTDSLKQTRRSPKEVLISPRLPLPEETSLKFSEGLAVKGKGRHYGYVNPLGQWVIPPIYTSATRFQGGRATIVIRGRRMVINRFRECIEGCDEMPSPVRLEARLPFEQDGRYGYKDKTGTHIVISARYDSARGFSEGLAAVKKNGRWGYISPDGRAVILPLYHDAQDFRNGRALVLNGEDDFFIDKQGRRIE